VKVMQGRSRPPFTFLRGNGIGRRSLELRQLIRKQRVLRKLRDEFAKVGTRYDECEI